jgi:hypothetical protein
MSIENNTKQLSKKGMRWHQIQTILASKVDLDMKFVK